MGEGARRVGSLKGTSQKKQYGQLSERSELLRGRATVKATEGNREGGKPGRHGDDPSQIYKPSFKVIKM